MTEKEVIKLLEKRETHKIEYKPSLSIEYKPSLSDIDRIIEVVCSFANAEGGIVLIGVKEEKERTKDRFVGITIGKDTIGRLINKITDKTDPPIYPNVEVIKVFGKNIVVIEVTEGRDKPYTVSGKPFIRIGDITKQMKRSEYERMLLEKNKEKLRFDTQMCDGADWKDIDEKKVRWFLKKAKAERNLDTGADIPLKEALSRLKLVHDGKLTNTAILLFGSDPQRFFLQARIRCARFKGITAQEFIDMKIIDGNIIDQIDSTEKFVLSHIKKAAKIIMFERQEVWEYPPEALREAIINAICHRDYSSTGNVQIGIYDDRIEVWNPGTLPEPLTPAMLKEEHISIPRNPLIANAFFLIRHIEQWGKGTNKIVEWCKNRGLKEPNFKESGGSFMVKFTAPEDILDLIPDKRKLNLKELGLNERQIEALRVMVNEKKTMTNAVYREMFKTSDRSALRDLKDLVQKGLVKRKGKRRASEYEAI
ncbi:MAG: helix-turn-helix domain-containing protein [Nitrospirota bacterium]